MEETIKIRNFLGFRGTTIQKAEAARLRREFDVSRGEDEYFGHGIYFFEEDSKEAINFARFQRQIPQSDIGVIEVDIIVERAKVYDLVMTEVYNEYIKLIDDIGRKYLGQRHKPQIKVPYDCRVINMICDDQGYKLVRGSFIPRHEKYQKLRVRGWTRIPRAHIQLCVRDERIIKEVR